MIDQKRLDGLATFAAAYLKRWLEGNIYDRLFKTEVGKKLKRLPKGARYAIEFGLYLLTVFFDQKLSDDTALKKFVKEVGVDVGPEISKRLINNQESQREKELVSILLELDDQALRELLNWFYEIEPTERQRILRRLCELSPEKVLRLSGLTPEDRRRLIDLLNLQASEEDSDRSEGKEKTPGETWGAGLQRWEEWLEERKKRKGQ